MENSRPCWEKKIDICAVGELIADFTPCGLSPQGMPRFTCNPGGAPGNVMACISRLGGTAAFIGKVGRDRFGSFLKNSLKAAGVDTRGVIEAQEANTTLAFVHLDEDGDRSFSFYRKNSADILLRRDEIDDRLLDSAEYFHFGSVSMTDEPARSATLSAVEYAKRAGKRISYDPNYRSALWRDEAEAKAFMRRGLEYADIVKVSEEELYFLAEGETVQDKIGWMMEKYPVSLLLVSMGGKGAVCAGRDFVVSLPAFAVEAVDTNGAGDAFMGGFLFSLLKKGVDPKEISCGEAIECLRFANAAGALATTKSGAIPAMPAYDEVLDCINRTPKARR